MMSLNNHQKESLSRYYKLISDYPLLFQQRKLRPIIFEPEILEKYVVDKGINLGIVASNDYVYFIVDLVKSQLADGTEHLHPYMRIVPIGQLNGGVNVVIIATIGDKNLGELGSIIIIEQERHATGCNEIGLPRGFGEVNLSGEENALKELREETGYIGEQAHLLGSTYTDSGIIDSKVFFYHVSITSRELDFDTNLEAIKSIYTLPISCVWEQIQKGHIRDGFTLQAISLYEKSSYAESTIDA